MGNVLHKCMPLLIVKGYNQLQIIYAFVQCIF